MDDILVLAPTRWWLRKAVKVLHRVFATLRLEKQPDKTFIGKIERGFDFLGYHFSPMGLRVATDTIVRFIEHAARLYEQERGGRFSSSPLGLYVKRWLRWVNAGIREDGMVLVLRDTGVLPVFPAPPKEAYPCQARGEEKQGGGFWDDLSSDFAPWKCNRVNIKVEVASTEFI